ESDLPDRPVDNYREVASARNTAANLDPDKMNTDYRKKLMLTSYSSIGKDRAWTKDNRGFARHWGEPEVRNTFEPLWWVPNQWVEEPFFSTEMNSYLIAYWLNESQNLFGDKYQKHLQTPEVCVQGNIASGKTPAAL